MRGSRVKMLVGRTLRKDRTEAGKAEKRAIKRDWKKFRGQR